MNKRYYILPFKFTRINNKELIVNEVGDYIFVPKGTTKRIVERDIIPQEDLYKDLLSRFIICEDYNNHLQNILATRIRTKKSFLDGFTSLHIFVLTLRCNQKCIYCQAMSKDNKSNHKDMSIFTLSKSIDLMLKSPNQHITMEFQGGESTLAYSLIEYAVRETQRKNSLLGKEIRYVLCSNIAYFDDRLLDLCEKHEIFISTSLDGPQYIHDHNRGIKGAYSTFCNSLFKIRKRLNKEYISPLMTTSELSLKHPKEIIDTYRELGFCYIFFTPT